MAGDGSRAGNHGEQMNNAEPVEADMATIHCHDCWTNTDAVQQEANRLHHAIGIVREASVTLEKSAAYTAAEEYLAAFYQKAKKQLGEDRLTLEGLLKQ